MPRIVVGLVVAAGAGLYLALAVAVGKMLRRLNELDAADHAHED